MKKTMRVLMLLALCLLLAVPAMAASEIVYESKDYLQLVHGMPLVTARGEAGVALLAIEGVPLTEAVYNEVTPVDGYLTASRIAPDGKKVYGVLNRDGQEMTEFKYDRVDIEGSWAWVRFSLPRPQTIMIRKNGTIRSFI